MQRRERSGGGDTSCTTPMSGNCWTWGASPVFSGTAPSIAHERSGATYCDSGRGACETKQQVVSGSVIIWVSPQSMFMWSHRDWVGGVAHSAVFKESSAQAESGACTIAKRLHASTKINGRRTSAQSSTRSGVHCVTVSTVSFRLAVRRIT